MRAAAAAPSRRQQSKWQREQRQQHTLFIGIGALLLVVLAIFAGGFVYDNVVRANEVIAQIGPDSISAAQLVDEMQPAVRAIEAQSKQVGGGTSAARNIDQYKRGLPDQTLNDLVDRHLIAQEAAQRGISVTPSEVEDKLRQTVADFQASTNPAPTPEPPPTPAASITSTAVPTLEESAYGAALQQLLDRNNMTDADFRKRLQENLLRDKLQKAIGEEQVATTQEQVHARHILVETQDQADDVLNQLHNRADFADLAGQLSTDTGTKDKGGDLGWFGRGVMDKAFEEAAFALQPGQLSEVVHSSFGYHIIQTLERGQRDVADAQLESQRQKAFTDWLGSRRTSQDVKLQMSQSERDWTLARIGVRP